VDFAPLIQRYDCEGLKHGFFRVWIAFHGIPIVPSRFHPFLPVARFCSALTSESGNRGDNGGVNHRIQ
jgi:hypothetical protein